MILEIESFFGDCTLSGPDIGRAELEAQIETIKRIYDRKRDNFVPLLCERFRWTPLEHAARPQYRYDRDVEQLFEVK